MTMPCSGLIGFHNLNAEFGHAPNSFLDLNYGPVRQLAGRPSTGFVAFSDLICKSWYTREPASGWNYSSARRWQHYYPVNFRVHIYWDQITGDNAGGDRNTTSVTLFGWNYIRGPQIGSSGPQEDAWYRIARQKWG